MKLRVFLLGYPLVEVALAIAVAHVIGWPLTIALLIAGVPVGIAITKRTSRHAFSTMSAQLSAGQMPGIAEAGPMIGGLLITIPGFFTDVVGGILLIPAVRNRVWGKRLPPSTGEVIRGEIIIHPPAPNEPRD
jgi:UPF0716 protein FxsA